MEKDFQGARFRKKGHFQKNFQGAHRPWVGGLVGQSTTPYKLFIFISLGLSNSIVRKQTKIVSNIEVSKILQNLVLNV